MDGADKRGAGMTEHDKFRILPQEPAEPKFAEGLSAIEDSAPRPSGPEDIDEIPERLYVLALRLGRALADRGH